MTLTRTHFWFIAIITVSITLWVYYPRTQSITLTPTSFSELPGWSSAHHLKSLQTFQASCPSFLKKKPDYVIGNQWVYLRAKDIQPACQAALHLKNPSQSDAKQFFQQWFKPATFQNGHVLSGLFTGYYLPEIKGSLVKTDQYTIPLYGVPKDLLSINLQDFDAQLPKRQLIGRLHNKQLVPYYSREDINNGAITHHAPVVAYIHSPIDRLFLEIQGSGTIKLDDGSTLSLNYAAKNGLPYTAIGKILIQRGILTMATMSQQAIGSYLEQHPDEQDEIINKNRSFVFFRILHQDGAFGSLNTKLTPGYSLAVDPDWVPLGLPLWVNTSRPDPNTDANHPFHRLMIAQDTGGAIKGAVRGDVFWGGGKNEAQIAGKMKNTGQYWLLLPRSSPAS